MRRRSIGAGRGACPVNRCWSRARPAIMSGHQSLSGVRRRRYPPFSILHTVRASLLGQPWIGSARARLNDGGQRENET